MNQWTRARWASFVIHVVFVSVPFLASSISALLLWYTLFGSWLLAIPAVLVVDVLALTGLVLFIAGVPSPFVPLRHALPFVSIVPLGRELYLLLEHNGVLVAVLVTLLAVGVLTAIAWKCFATIEALFIDPVQAAREKAREQLSLLSIELAQLTEKNAVVGDFVTAWQRQTVTATIREDMPGREKAPQALTETKRATLPPAYTCPNCSATLTLGAYGAARRHGHCAACKEV